LCDDKLPSPLVQYKRPETWDSVTSFFRESLNSRNYWGYLVILSTSYVQSQESNPVSPHG
jgi:hypothetical protein